MYLKNFSVKEEGLKRRDLVVTDYSPDTTKEH